MRFLLVTVTDSGVHSRAQLDAVRGQLERQSAEMELVLVTRSADGRSPKAPAASIRAHRVESPLVIGLSRVRKDALA